MSRSESLRDLFQVPYEPGDIEEEPVTIGPSRKVYLTRNGHGGSDKPLRLVDDEDPNAWRKTRKGPPKVPRRSKRIPDDPGPPAFDPDSGMTADEHARFEAWMARRGPREPRSVLPTGSWMDRSGWCQPVGKAAT